MNAARRIISAAKTINGAAKTFMNTIKVMVPIRSVFCLLPAMLGLCGVTGQAAGPEPAGWYCGDIHVHRDCGSSPTNVAGLYSVMVSQDMAVLSLLADMGNGEVQDATTDLPLVNGKDASVSTAGRLLHWDAEWHWDADYTQYPHQALGGHIVALGLTNAYQIWSEPTYPIFEWAHQQGGIGGFAHFEYLDDSFPTNLTCCTPIDYPVEVALGDCDFISEDVGGSDYFIHAYYRLLNCGFRPGFAAGSDWPCELQSGGGGTPAIGPLLTYCQVAGGQLTYSNWIHAIALGRTMVTRNGRNEFVSLVVNGTNTPGDEIHLSAAGSVPVTVTWTAQTSLTGTLELVCNGVVVASQQATAGPGAPVTLSTTVNFPASGWLCARRMDPNLGHQAHTAAVFVTVNGAPVRANSNDAQFYVQWMENLLAYTSPGGVWNSFFPTTLTAVQARYQTVLSMYQQIVTQAGGVQPPPVVPIGNANSGEFADNIWGGSAWINAGRFQAVSNAAASTVYAKVGAIAGHYKCAIYADAGGSPSAFLCGTAEVSNPADGWQAFPLTSSFTLNNGTYYWLAIWSDDANAEVYYWDNSGTLRWGQYNYGTWPNPIATTGGGSFDYCIYAAGSLVSIAVTPTNATLLTGTSQPFTATGTYSDGSTANITSQASWTSSLPSVATIAIGGVVTAVSAGTTTISASLGVTGSTTLTVQTPPLALVTTNVPGGTVNTTYSATLTAMGGTLPYSWGIASGSLPPGLSLNPASGAITGTPTNTGVYVFTVRVWDSSNPVQTAAGQLSMTIAALPAVATIWPSTTVPGTVDGGPDSAVELGVKFQSDVAGTITGIRFYKATANTGTHVGNLWSSTGTLLGSITFSNETASGWQQILLATPVAITSNTVYVASYHCTIGHYSEDDNYFLSNGVNNPPLHALTNGVSGGNGVYGYGTSSTFPTLTYNAANYWVDVVFQGAAAPTLASIAVTPANSTDLAGATQQFTATGTYSDGSTQNVTSQATWSSSKTNVATISTSGLATAVSAGSTTISATLTGVAGSTTLTVQTPPTLASIAVTPANPTNVVGATQQFTATGTYSDGSTQNLSSRVTWSSSKTAVATVNTNGLATAATAGSTTISAALSGLTGSTTLTVQAVPLVMSTTSMPTGTVSVAYSATLLATGGTTPYTWGIASGTLPGGLALNTATGAIAGTPTNAGTFSFTARVSDGSSPQQVASNALSLTISSAPTSVTIWPSTAVPGTADSGPDSAVELGVKFRSDVNGKITGIRFYKAAANTGTHVGNLWSTNGTLLGSITFSNETASGWQQMLLASPVAITSNTVYVASYHCTVGHYSEDDNYFLTNGVNNPPLHALTNGVSGGNGVYAYGTSSAFPSSTWEAANYWVDVVFQGGPAPTLTSIAVTPANPTNVVGATQQFTATGTYSDGSTQNLSSRVTWTSSKTAVATVNTNGLATAATAGSTTISAALSGLTGSTTLTVQAVPLVMSTTSMPTGTVSVAYSATLLATGGTTPYTWGIASGTLPGGLALNTATGAIAGTPTNAGTFSFTARVSDASSPQQVASNALSISISSAPTSVTIWPSTAVPGTADSGPDSAVELGVKFRSDVNGDITGIRFYKAAANTGTHVGNLWSTNGTLLGSITFSNETASGWQQMLLAGPVAITSNTVYVASYHCTVGHYSEDDNYFLSNGVNNPPLHALTNGVSGGNGVYAYGTSSTFPTLTYNAANYWVDVVFATP